MFVIALLQLVFPHKIGKISAPKVNTSVGFFGSGSEDGKQLP